MTWQIFKPNEISAEHRAECVSGYDLSKIYSHSAAHYMYQEREEEKNLDFGIAARQMLLDPEAFDNDFVRGVDKTQYPDALVTAKDMWAWLGDRGMKKTGTKPDLTARILEAEPATHIMDKLQLELEAVNEDKTILDAEDYDSIQGMRALLMDDPEVSAMINGGFTGYTITGEVIGVKLIAGISLITSAGGIVRYTTTRDCHPERFGKRINDYGYLLRAALEWECFKRAYGKEPAYYILLSQEKKAPFVFKPYNVDKDALEIGRIQLETALKTYARCVKSGKWPAYGTDIEDVMIPEFVKRQYGVGDK